MAGSPPRRGDSRSTRPTQPGPGSPPADTAGATTGARVGSRQAHVNVVAVRGAPIACPECHVVAACTTEPPNNSGGLPGTLAPTFGLNPTFRRPPRPPAPARTPTATRSRVRRRLPLLHQRAHRLRHLPRCASAGPRPHRLRRATPGTGDLGQAAAAHQRRRDRPPPTPAPRRQVTACPGDRFGPRREPGPGVASDRHGWRDHRRPGGSPRPTCQVAVRGAPLACWECPVVAADHDAPDRHARDGLQRPDTGGRTRPSMRRPGTLLEHLLPRAVGCVDACPVVQQRADRLRHCHGAPPPARTPPARLAPLYYTGYRRPRAARRRTSAVVTVLRQTCSSCHGGGLTPVASATADQWRQPGAVAAGRRGRRDHRRPGRRAPGRT